MDKDLDWVKKMLEGKDGWVCAVALHDFFTDWTDLEYRDLIFTKLCPEERDRASWLYSYADSQLRSKANLSGSPPTQKDLSILNSNRIRGI